MAKEYEAAGRNQPREPLRQLKRSAKLGLVKPVNRKVGEWRSGLVNATPERARPAVDRIFDYLDMIFVDHGIFRIFYANRFEIADGVWRSSQPWPHQVRSYARMGIRTIVNLRGERDCGSYRLEIEACRKYGIELVEYKLRSRSAPQPEVITDFEAFFNALEHPILIHCKSGADRVGLASTLYLYLIKRSSLEDAQKQLHARYGHFKHASTGIIDHFFEQYSEYAKVNPISLREWVDNVYDRRELKASFKASYWSSVLVDKILRRE